MALKTSNKNREKNIEVNPLETHWVPQSKFAPKETDEILQDWVPLEGLAHHETEEELQEFLKNKS